MAYVWLGSCRTQTPDRNSMQRPSGKARGEIERCQGNFQDLYLKWLVFTDGIEPLSYHSIERIGDEGPPVSPSHLRSVEPAGVSSIRILFALVNCRWNCRTRRTTGKTRRGTEVFLKNEHQFQDCNLKAVLSIVETDILMI